MDRHEAGKITDEYIKPVFGFTLKRCRNLQDAEDLSQEIILKIFHSLIKRDDIENVGKFVWTIAHNSLSNYYRDNKHNFIGASIDEFSEIICDNQTDLADDLELREASVKLQGEIAYLSKIQRRIVIMYYYENKKQNEIAFELNIPVGTVKWHLFEAKKELKRGMDNMRLSSELRFNPIKFSLCGTNGSPGSKGSNSNFFRSALSQNIEYTIWKAPKTINEIADALGVSPVYIESEVEYLEEYGFIIKRGEKYYCNILIDENIPEVTRLRDEMYYEAAKIFANELYDELIKSDIWDNPKLKGGHTDISETLSGKRDINFFLWALIPYIAALSGESMREFTVSFDDAATIRPDGGHNICYASVVNSDSVLPKYFDSMQCWCGPCWNRSGNLILWQIDTEWSDRRVDNIYHLKAEHALSLLQQVEYGSEISRDDYVCLAECGIIKTVDNSEIIKPEYKCVFIDGSETKKELLAIGNRIKLKYNDKFEVLRKPFIEAVLKETPKHLHIMQKYGLQFTFYSDGWFILHCLKELINNGKLEFPTNDQKRALTTVLIKE